MKLLFALALSLISFIGYSQSSILQYCKYEVELTQADLGSLWSSVSCVNSNDSKCFEKDQIRLIAEFTSPTNQVIVVDGFYQENVTLTNSTYSGTEPGYGNFFFKFLPKETAVRQNTFSWKVRFSPQISGTWIYNLKFILANGNILQNFIKSTGTFTCIPNPNIEDRFVKATSTGFSIGENHFIPLGINVANVPEWTEEKPGTNFYEIYFKRLNENGCNFSRIFINDYQAFYLVGRRGCDQYLKQFNQVSSKQIDKVIELAEQYNIKLQICLYLAHNLNDFSEPSQFFFWQNDNTFNSSPSVNCTPQINGPYTNANDFFNLNGTNSAEGWKIQQNLVRYIIDRWGYSNSVFSWELFNESDFINYSTSTFTEWSDQVTSLIKLHDQYERPVSSSFCFLTPTGSRTYNHEGYGNSLIPETDYRIAEARNYDFNQRHHYLSNVLYQSESKSEFFRETKDVRDVSGKPTLIVEAGSFSESFSPNNDPTKTYPLYKYYETIDPFGTHFHSDLWASLFMGGAGPIVYWEWLSFIDRNNSLYPASNYMLHFQAVRNYIDRVKIIENAPDNEYHNSCFENWISNGQGLNITYVQNPKTNRTQGYIQDYNYSIKRLQGTFDQASSTDINTLVFTGRNSAYLDRINSSSIIYPQWDSPTKSFNLQVPKCGKYKVEWTNTTTGNIGWTEIVNANYNNGNWVVFLQLPVNILNMLYGDAVFEVTKVSWDVDAVVTESANSFKLNTDIKSIGKNLFFTRNDGLLSCFYEYNSTWRTDYLDGSSKPVFGKTSFDIDFTDPYHPKCFYFGNNNGLAHLYKTEYTQANVWSTVQLISSNLSINSNSEIHLTNNQGFYFNGNNNLSAFYQYNNAWYTDIVNPQFPTKFGTTGFAAVSENPWTPSIYFFSGISTNATLTKATYNNGWIKSDLISNVPVRSNSELHYSNGQGFFINNNGEICSFFNANNTWGFGPLNSNAPKAINGSGFSVHKQNGTNEVFYTATDQKLYTLYFDAGASTWLWKETINGTCANNNYLASGNGDIYGRGNHIYFVNNDYKPTVLSNTSEFLTNKTEYDYYDNIIYNFESNNDQRIIGKLTGVSFYPNPSTSDLHIESETEIYRIKIISHLGLLEFDETYSGSYNKVTLSINQLKPGLYFLEIHLANTSITRKFIKI